MCYLSMAMCLPSALCRGDLINLTIIVFLTLSVPSATIKEDTEECERKCQDAKYDIPSTFKNCHPLGDCALYLSSKGFCPSGEYVEKAVNKCYPCSKICDPSQYSQRCPKFCPGLVTTTPVPLTTGKEYKMQTSEPEKNRSSTVLVLAIFLPTLLIILIILAALAYRFRMKWVCFERHTNTNGSTHTGEDIEMNSIGVQEQGATSMSQHAQPASADELNSNGHCVAGTADQTHGVGVNSSLIIHQPASDQEAGRMEATVQEECDPGKSQFVPGGAQSRGKYLPQAYPGDPRYKVVCPDSETESEEEETDVKKVC